MEFVRLNGEKGIGQERFCRLLAKVEGQWNPSLEKNPDGIFPYGRKIYEKSLIIGVTMDGKIAGFAAVYVNDHGTKQAYLTYIAFLEEYTHLGLGTKLLGRVIEQAEQAGMTSIKLEVRKTNARARAFYRKLGFAELSEASAQSVYMARDIRLSGEETV